MQYLWWIVGSVGFRLSKVRKYLSERWHQTAMSYGASYALPLLILFCALINGAIAWPHLSLIDLNVFTFGWCLAFTLTSATTVRRSKQIQAETAVIELEIERIQTEIAMTQAELDDLHGYN